MNQISPIAIHLRDYAPVNYHITDVNLCFSLHETATRVRSRLSITPANPGGGGALRLDGEKITLHSVAIDDCVLPSSGFSVDATGLTLHAPPTRAFTLTIETECNPSTNTELSGLYLSNGMFCTQCEAEGFRRITYFHDRPDVMARYRVRVEGDTQMPVLLSNGNRVAAGSIEETDRHFAEWDDPFPKPSYLFALVAGRLACLQDHFVTCEGRTVSLGIYVEPGKEERCQWAMAALKASMRWDEDRFGRAYDLDVFNIVAVSHFNMGAMENKGLNIFNDKYILATPETATDVDYANVEAIIAHEYFHNWTGNRITCRDWFQLCLKEGLTVYRDQEFTSDVRSRPVKRISDVRTLRARQFPEDGGPLAHPVRPESYIEINNFYTPTVYEKGAEICRMLALLIGRDSFRRGMDVFFKRHDGQAVTVEDFVACFAETSGRNLQHFFRWYQQSGTPRVVATGHHDAATSTYELTVEQVTPPTPDQPQKAPLHIPMRVGLIDPQGTDLPLTRAGSGNSEAELLEITEARQTFRFHNVADRPVLSLNRGFSAPVLLTTNSTAEDELFAMSHDSDSFNRWQAGQTRGLALITDRYLGRATARDVVGYADALRRILADSGLDAAFRGLMLALPTEADVASAIGSEVDATLVREARDDIRTRLAQNLMDHLQQVWAETTDESPYQADPASTGRRLLRYGALGFLLLGDAGVGQDLARRELETAAHMTARWGVLSALAPLALPYRDVALAAFHETTGGDSLLIDKWFTLMAQTGGGAAIRSLMAHRDFVLTLPNRVNALVATFMSANPAGFHAANGTGYAVAAEAVIAADAINPQLAARLATGFRSWRTYSASSRAHADAALQRILAVNGLSPDCFEIVSKIARPG